MVPAVFWRMTAREFMYKLQGYYDALQDQREHDWDVAAQIAAWGFNAHGGKMTAAQLLGKSSTNGGGKDFQTMTAEERETARNELIAKMERQRAAAAAAVPEEGSSPEETGGEG